MGDVDDVEKPEDDGQAEGDERDDQPPHQAVHGKQDSDSARTWDWAAWTPTWRGSSPMPCRCFSDLGARVVEVDGAAPDFDGARETFETLGFPGIALSVAWFTEEEQARMDPGLTAVARLGERVGIMDCMIASRARERLGLAHERVPPDP